jgi:hypothetical protein
MCSVSASVLKGMSRLLISLVTLLSWVINNGCCCTVNVYNEFLVFSNGSSGLKELVIWVLMSSSVKMIFVVLLSSRMLYKVVLVNAVHFATLAKSRMLILLFSVRYQSLNRMTLWVKDYADSSGKCGNWCGNNCGNCGGLIILITFVASKLMIIIVDMDASQMLHSCI